VRHAAARSLEEEEEENTRSGVTFWRRQFRTQLRILPLGGRNHEDQDQ